MTDFPVDDVPVPATLPEATDTEPASEALVIEDAPEAVDETPAPAPDPYEEFGGRDTIERAHRIWQASQTREGLVDIFAEAGAHLGLSVEQLQAFFKEPAPEDDPDYDPERPLTVKEFQDLQSKQAQEAAEKERARNREAGFKAAQATIAELGLKSDAEELVAIYQLGDKYLAGDTSPESVSNAIKRGYADFQALIQKQHEAYLKRKQEVAASVPGAPSGGAPPAEPPAPEPQSVAEATKLAKARGYFR